MRGNVRSERVSAHVELVTIAREAKLNAMTMTMWDEMSGIFERINGDNTVRCVVLRGEGTRAFSVGADISEFTEHRNNAKNAKAFQKFSHRAFHLVEECPHPVVTAIAGACAGGGLELSAVTDLRIAGASARFGVPIKRLGLVVSYDEVKRMLRIVSPAVAYELLFEGQMYSAADALRMGLLNRVVADADVFTESLATAERIAEGAPLAARWHKKFIKRVLHDPAPISETENDEVFACFDTQDFRTGFQAFLEKTKPAFAGR
jgi:enoyl-CoA hydratase